jgi:glycosyltransferase involved in cell wall biosynthesis
MTDRILIVAHGHPSVNKGGAELAAYQMFKEYEKRGHDVKFLARSGESPHGGAAFSSRDTDKEILFHTTHDDFFLFSNLKTRYLWQEFRDLLQRFKPDVVHFHHYFLLGVEMMLEVKNTLPNCKVVLTLHEYLAICHNKGLMIKKSTNQLCKRATVKDCHLCFPDQSTADFFMREMYLKRMLSEADHFISPSFFLKQRYVDWGIHEDKISVIENGQDTATVDVSNQVYSQGKKIRLAFFGQINQYKGVDILLEALGMLDSKTRKKVIVELHGANLELQPKSFIKRIKSLLKEYAKNVTFHGAYDPEDLGKLMSKTDWLVVPSIWWENSPLVIQEAFNYKVPVITSDVGGMAEKVEHNLTGLHFRVGKAKELAETIQRIIEEPKLRAELASNIVSPPSIESTANQTIAVYHDINKHIGRASQ